MNQTVQKLGVVAVALAVFGWLFWQSVQSSLSEPYVVNRNLVTSWQLVLRGPALSGGGLLVLQPNDQLRAELFQQIFSRTMESMMSPAEAAMPLVLHDEFRTLGESLTVEELQLAAEEAGLEDVVPIPVCIGHVRRPPAEQLYYALFAAPEIDRFRRDLMRARGDGGSFALAIPLAASDGNFASWWPLDVTDADCLAPLEAG